MSGPDDAASIAAAIVADHQAGRRFPGYAPQQGANLDLAYAIQDRVVAAFRAAGRGTPAGWKIGLTSASMRAFCNLDHPLAGVILDRGVAHSPARTSLAAYGRLGLECEICLRTARDLPPQAGPLDHAAAEELVASVAPAFELIDDRAASYDGLDAFSIIADNGWNAGIVLGEELAAWPDLAACTGRLAIDGTMIDQGAGADVLGHPLAALSWLAAHLGARGETLPAGSLVMTGSMVRTQFAEAGRHYTFQLNAHDGRSMGGVELQVED